MQDYARFHKNRTNLLLHIVVVPLFVLGVVYAVVAAIQGVGHKKEPNPPLPFEGPGEFFTRIFAEQFYRFPKFVLSGEWLRALRASR